MESKRKVEVFSAGCALCEEVIDLVRREAGSSTEVIVRKMIDARVLARAEKRRFRQAQTDGITKRFSRLRGVGGGRAKTSFRRSGESPLAKYLYFPKPGPCGLHDAHRGHEAMSAIPPKADILRCGKIVLIRLPRQRSRVVFAA
jgi:hypothetical protein